MLGSPNDDGHFQERVEYDLSGKALRKKFTTLFVAWYGKDKLFIDRDKEITTELDRANIFKQGVVTKIINKELPVMEQICKHWCKTGQPINIVRLLISEALDNRIDKSDIARFIQANEFNDKISPWNGVASGDKKYDAIAQTVF